MSNGSGCLWPVCDDTGCVWMRSEFLLWWTKGSPNPSPLLTSVPAGTTGTTPPIPGAVGNASTQIVMGDSSIDLGTRTGGLFTIGTWLDHEHLYGLEGDYFFLGSSTENQYANSTGGVGSTKYYVPIYDPTGNLTGGTPGHTALPTVLGTIFNVTGGYSGPYISHDALTLKSQTQGAELHGIVNLYRQGRMRVDSLVGFRYLNLYEHLTFANDSQSVPSATTQVTYDTLDSFETTNNFYGGQLGLRFECTPDDGRGGWQGGFDFRADAKVALGATLEGANINGSTFTNLGNPMLATPAYFNGGVFAQPTNIGRYSQSDFAVLPEVNLSVGYAIVPCVRIFMGYDFLWLSDVARPVPRSITRSTSTVRDWRRPRESRRRSRTRRGPISTSCKAASGAGPELRRGSPFLIRQRYST